MGFWIFLSVVVFATIYQETAQQTARAKLLQAALEKGKDLDPQVLERLFSGDGSDNKKDIFKDPRRLRIAAVVVASIGVGLGVMAIALRQIDTEPFWVFLGLGGLMLVVSVGLAIASRMIGAQLPSDGSSFQSQT